MQSASVFYVRLKWATVLFIVFSVGSMQAFSQNGPAYNPRFWTDGIADDIAAGENESAHYESLVTNAWKKGWGGIMYWGAVFEGEQMRYHFKSPFLDRQEWALPGKDGLSPLMKAARLKGMKIALNIEGVNPYHWQQHKWTPASITSVANDIAATGADVVFEECFEAAPEIFTALAATLKSKSVTYISGTDPMLLRENYFTGLWPQTGMINSYDYYLKRDKLFSIATLAQNGSLSLGWAKYWRMPMSVMSPVTRDWGIGIDYSPAVVRYLSLIRALQFRVNDFFVLGGMDQFDPTATKKWIQAYVKKQEPERPVMNLVVLLDKSKDKVSDAGWNYLFNSADAITSGAFHGGYNIIVSDKVIPADAYWIYAKGGINDTLPADVTTLFNSDKPVFLQSGNSIPGGAAVEPNWKKALAACGVNASYAMPYAGGTVQMAEASLPQDQAEEIPYTGYYKNHYLRFTGTDIQRGSDLRSGTVIPEKAISGKIHAYPNSTYGKGPYIVGRNNKYLITTNTLHWQAAYPVSDLLSGSGIHPSSNVWGIAGKKLTALLAVENTQLTLELPGAADGAELHVIVWDKQQRKTMDKKITYRRAYVQFLNEYDLLLIETIQ